MSLTLTNGALLRCGDALVSGIDCSSISLPSVGKWNWKVVNNQGGFWSGLDSSRPIFNWTVSGELCGGTRGDFLGEIKTTAIFQCETTVNCKVSGLVERFQAGYDEGAITINSTQICKIISDSDEFVECEMKFMEDTGSASVFCCVEIVCRSSSNDDQHHRPAYHQYEFSGGGIPPPIFSGFYYNIGIEQIDPEAPIL